MSAPTLTYKRGDTLGAGWTLLIQRSGVTIGRILKGTDGSYRCYRGPGGAGTSLLEPVVAENFDLEALKEWLGRNLDKFPARRPPRQAPKRRRGPGSRT